MYMSRIVSWYCLGHERNAIPLVTPSMLCMMFFYTTDLRLGPLPLLEVVLLEILLARFHAMHHRRRCFCINHSSMSRGALEIDRAAVHENNRRVKRRWLILSLECCHWERKREKGAPQMPLLLLRKPRIKKRGRQTVGRTILAFLWLQDTKGILSQGGGGGGGRLGGILYPLM